MTDLFAEITEKGLALDPVEGQPSFRSWEPFPGSGARFYLRAVDDRVIAWGLATSFDHRDAIAFMASVTPELLDEVSESAPLAIREAGAKPFGRFTHLCIVHPSWAQFSLNAKTAFMMTRVHQVLPCFRCELTVDDTFAEFRFRRGRGPVDFNDPFREPQPAVAMRYEHLLPKRTGSSGGKKMGVFPWSDVRKHVLVLPEADGFVELESFERVRVNITHRDGLWHVAEKKRRWEPFAGDIEPWLTALCFEGREAAERVLAPPTSGVDPVERAIRAVCAAVDVDHAPDLGGELPEEAVDGMFTALRTAGKVDVVALRTAALACVEPQLPAPLAAEALARLGESAELRASDWATLSAVRGASPSNAAWECLAAACACASAPDLQSWRRMLRAYREARLPSGAGARAVAILARDWAGRVVPAATDSSIRAELSSLREVIGTARPVPAAAWFFDASVAENGVHFVSIAERGTRRVIRDVLSGTTKLVGRVMQWEVRSLDSIPLGRLRTEELVERVILSDLANGYYAGRFDRLEYADTDAADSWARDVAP